MITNEEYAKHLWTYDDGHDYHYIYTTDHERPATIELKRKYGTIVYHWKLISDNSMEDEDA